MFFPSMATKKVILLKENRDGVRFSWNVWPRSHLQSQKLPIPIGCVFQPLKEAKERKGQLGFGIGKGEVRGSIVIMGLCYKLEDVGSRPNEFFLYISICLILVAAQGHVRHSTSNRSGYKKQNK
jgi:hypothetical protein